MLWHRMSGLPYRSPPSGNNSIAGADGNLPSCRGPAACRQMCLLNVSSWQRPMRLRSNRVKKARNRLTRRGTRHGPPTTRTKAADAQNRGRHRCLLIVGRPFWLAPRSYSAEVCRRTEHRRSGRLTKPAVGKGPLCFRRAPDSPAASERLSRVDTASRRHRGGRTGEICA